MSYKQKLIFGLAMDLIVLDGPYEGRYRTRIEEVGEKLLSVGAPFHHGEIVPLREGSKVKLTFYDEVAAYSFEGEIMQRIAVPIPMFVLILPDMIEKVQRRDFVRVAASYPVTFQVVNRLGLSDVYKATLLDISGGGLRFSTKEHLEKNSLLFIQLSLPKETMQRPVRITRVEKIQDTNRFIVSVQFHEISEREREVIIRCVFDIQREMRKKGLV